MTEFTYLRDVFLRQMNRVGNKISTSYWTPVTEFSEDQHVLVAVQKVKEGSRIDFSSISLFFLQLNKPDAMIFSLNFSLSPRHSFHCANDHLFPSLVYNILELDPNFDDHDKIQNSESNEAKPRSSTQNIESRTVAAEPLFFLDSAAAF